MSFKHGSKTELWLGSVDLSSYFRGLDLSVDVDTAETTAFKKTWKTNIPGVAASKVSLDGMYDAASTDVRTTLAATAGSVLTIGPAGMAAAGDLARLISVLSTTYAESAPVGDVVALKWGVIADGQIGFGETVHPLGTDSGTTTGASLDDAVATGTGAIAHLHAIAVTSGSWVVKLQDSANNSTWADVTGGAFTAAVAAGSQRLVIATQLRRYIRYVATVTGGSTPTITFGLAVART